MVGARRLLGMLVREVSLAWVHGVPLAQTGTRRVRIRAAAEVVEVRVLSHLRVEEL